MGWDEVSGAVSRSFDKWKLVDKDIRTFLNLTTRWAASKYEETWNASEQKADIGSSANQDGADEFSRRVEHLWPDDYNWMLRAAVVRDAVTAFEVYLEESLDEVLARRARVQVRRRRPHESPPWHILVRGHGMMGNEVETDRIKHIRALRHTLTHQRGELRTEEMRKKFAADVVLATDVDSGEEIWDRAYVGGKVQLTSDIVSEVLDDLGSAVRSADQRVWAIAWGRASAPQLDALREQYERRSTGG